MKSCRRQRQHQVPRIPRSFLIPVVLLLGLSGCASPSARERLDERQSQSRARGAAYAAEGFTVDYTSPEPRPSRAWEFYYKNCTLVSRNPYPNRSEYNCTDPF